MRACVGAQDGKTALDWAKESGKSHVARVIDVRCVKHAFILSAMVILLLYRSYGECQVQEFDTIKITCHLHHLSFLSLSLCLSLSLSLSLSRFPLSLSVFSSLSLYFSLFLYLSPSPSPSLTLSHFLSLSVSLSPLCMQSRYFRLPDEYIHLHWRCFNHSLFVVSFLFCFSTSRICPPDSA